MDPKEVKLTPYQAAQLLHKHLEGDFCFKNSKGNKVPNPVWRKMIQTLLSTGFLSEGKGLPVTQSGREWLFANVNNIKGLDCGCGG